MQRITAPAKLVLRHQPRPSAARRLIDSAIREPCTSSLLICVSLSNPVWRWRCGVLAVARPRLRRHILTRRAGEGNRPHKPELSDALGARISPTQRTRVRGHQVSLPCPALGGAFATNNRAIGFYSVNSADWSVCNRSQNAPTSSSSIARPHP